MIQLSKASMPVDVSEEGGKIIARFVGADIGDDLVRRLDVTDFATPVRYVDTRRTEGGAVITIEPEGTWDYLAYQADNQFSINIKPLTASEKERQRREAFKYDGEKLSLNFQDIEVRSVLQLIADFTDLNLVASDTVTGRITLRLQSVPWDQALDLILKTKGLDKRQVGNVLLVAPADEIAAREKQELEAQKQLASLAPLRTEYISINYARAEQLQTLITSRGGADGSSLVSERGSVTVDQRTNTLIVQDTADSLEDIRDLIQRLDVPVQQVLIEARVVIASTNVADEFGVRWGAWAGKAVFGMRVKAGASPVAIHRCVICIMPTWRQTAVRTRLKRRWRSSTKRRITTSSSTWAWSPLMPPASPSASPPWIPALSSWSCPPWKPRATASWWPRPRCSPPTSSRR
ncbi:Type IV pilus biogenesis and competence protein PilQ [Alcanivorax sp. ALC70]|nr:Type IV pilus biogenesis and competence protein PilQ [Alcanivorax sp. ALC70]